MSRWQDGRQRQAVICNREAKGESFAKVTLYSNWWREVKLSIWPHELSAGW